MFSKLFNQETEFERYMKGYAENIQKAGERFLDFIRHFDPQKMEAWIQEIKDIEHACDSITHQTMNWLESTFIVDFDREDIHRLATDLDDIVDSMDAAATRISLYNLTDMIPDVVHLSEVLSHACQATTCALRQIAGQKLHRRVLEDCKNIKNFEEEGDKIYHRLLASLFKGDKDPLFVIKFKEIVEDIERALDKCNQTAMNIESIIFKYS